MAAHLAGAADLSDALSALRRHVSLPSSSGAGGPVAGARQPRGRRAFSGVHSRQLQQCSRGAGRALVPQAAKQNADLLLRDPESRFRRWAGHWSLGQCPNRDHVVNLGAAIGAAMLSCLQHQQPKDRDLRVLGFDPRPA